MQLTTPPQLPSNWCAPGGPVSSSPSGPSPSSMPEAPTANPSLNPSPTPTPTP